MALKEFAIVLTDSHDGSYHAGDTLCGKVLITLKDGENHEQYEKLRIIVSGQAINSWFEKTEDAKKAVQILEEEEYINFEAEMTIDASTKMEKAEYGFEYELSQGLPSSFVGVYGKIIYAIKASLEGVTQKTETVKEFLVRGRLDLNEVVDAAQSVNINLTQPLLFRRGHLGMEVKLTKSGFLPGENIPIYSKLTNGSDKTVNVSLFLVKETNYYAKDRKVTDSEIITAVNGPRVKPRETEVWSGDLIQVPILPFSFLQNSHIINICYRLVIEIEIPIPNINLEGTIPILIGTTPFDEGLRTGKTGERTNGCSEPVTPALPSSRTNEKRGGGRIRARQKRPMTTCLVFRPEKPRHNLPTPKPETWRRELKIPGIDASTTTSENDLDALGDVVSDMLVLNRNKEKDDNDGKPPCFAPPFPGKKSEKEERRKWPEGYIRKRGVSPGRGKKSTNHNTENEMPPPKPARLNKESLIQSNDNDLLPYPKENPDNFPLPDFSFNVVVNGQRKQPLGWNVTRNTLSLKRAQVAAGFVLPLPTVGWSADPETK